jgi:hypothetical protein
MNRNFVQRCTSRKNPRIWQVLNKRVIENRVLRRIFGPKTDEVTGEWRKLHNEELNDLYCLLTGLEGSGENYMLRSLMISTAY